MTHIKTIFFLVVCLAVGVGIGKTYLWLTAPKLGFTKSEGPPLITGVGDAPAQRGFAVRAGRPPTEAMLKEWEAAYATTLGISCDAGLTDKALADAVKVAQAHHLQVALLPPMLGAGAGGAEDPYPQGLHKAAVMAQQAGVEYLCASDWGAAPEAAYWQARLEDARLVFKGRIILAARPQVIFAIDLWKMADLVGVVGPLPLARRLPDAPADVTVHDMRVAWDCSLTSLESLAKVNDKKLALLHMNVPAEVSARLPAAAGNVPPAKNPALQRMIYEALLWETKGRAERTEMLLFNWGEAGEADAPNNIAGLLGKFGEAWDPQKLRPVEMAPAEPAADDADAAAAATAGN